MTEDEEFECMICMSDESLDFIFIVDECQHKFCIDCVQDYFKIKLREGSSMNINCPGDGCDTICGQDEILQYLDSQDALKFFKNEKNLFPQNLIQEDDNKDLKVVFCPIDDYCILQNTKKFQQFECKICLWKMCSRCDKQHDFGLTCEEAKRKLEDDSNQALNLAYYKAEGFKACPGCDFMTSRISGCN